METRTNNHVGKRKGFVTRVSVSASISIELKERLKKKMERDGSSYSDEIEMALELYLED